jgi:glycosyltransferase involved in cell wall biosynthesis
MEGVPNLDFRPTAFGLEWMHDIQRDMELSQEFLLSLIREVRPDFLHFNQFYYGAIDCDVPRLVVAHSDVVSWWRAVHGQTPPESEWLRWYRSIVIRGIKQADAVAAPSGWMLDTLSEIYIQPENGRVIYNGRSPTLFNPHISKSPYVLSVGRVWDSGKQVTLLCRRDLPLECYIAGSDRHPDASLRLERALDTSSIPQLHFKGEQSELQLRQLYARAAIYAAPSRYEPFGLAPLEAALSRCALLMNDIPSFRELWDNAAYFFDQNSAESLMAALRKISEDATLRRDLANRAYERALRLFSTSRMADEYLALYEKAAAHKTLAA